MRKPDPVAGRRAGARGLFIALAIVTGLAACAPAVPEDAHVPPFARVPYAPISRAAVVAIALREWRLFGEPGG